MKNQQELTCTDLLKLALSGRPSIFDRLAYLAGMRDENSGRYCGATLSFTFDPADVDRAAREQHAETFSAWLCLNLKEQMADLTRYLAQTTTDRREILREWMRSKWYEKLIPANATAPERLLFVTDLETVLALMYHSG